MKNLTLKNGKLCLVFLRASGCFSSLMQWLHMPLLSVQKICLYKRHHSSHVLFTCLPNEFSQLFKPRIGHFFHVQWTLTSPKLHFISEVSWKSGKVLEGNIFFRQKPESIVDVFTRPICDTLTTVFGRNEDVLFRSPSPTGLPDKFRESLCHFYSNKSKDGSIDRKWTREEWTQWVVVDSPYEKLFQRRTTRERAFVIFNRVNSNKAIESFSRTPRASKKEINFQVFKPSEASKHLRVLVCCLRQVCSSVDERNNNHQRHKRHSSSLYRTASFEHASTFDKSSRLYLESSGTLETLRSMNFFSVPISAMCHES